MSRTRVLLLLAAIASFVPLCVGAASADACSPQRPSLAQVQIADDYGPDIVVNGHWFAEVVGQSKVECPELVYTALTDVEVTATWSTPGGTVVDTQAGTVDPESFDLATLSFAPPAGAFMVSFEATAGGEKVTDEPLVIQFDYPAPTTTEPPAPPTPPTGPTTPATVPPTASTIPPAAPAGALPASADYTG